MWSCTRARRWLTPTARAALSARRPRAGRRRTTSRPLDGLWLWDVGCGCCSLAIRGSGWASARCRRWWGREQGERATGSEAVFVCPAGRALLAVGQLPFFATVSDHSHGRFGAVRNTKQTDESRTQKPQADGRAGGSRLSPSTPPSGRDQDEQPHLPHTTCFIRRASKKK